MAHDVFVSYSSKDKHAADAVCAVLERNAIRCWIAPRDVLPGMAWGSAIINAIHDAKIIVLVFSGNANTSPQIEREVERPISHGVPIIPFRIEDVQPSHSLEYFISASHWLDAFTGPMEQHLETLSKVVQHIIELKQGKDAVGAIVESATDRQAPERAPSVPVQAPPVSAPSGSKPWMLVGGGALAGVAIVLAVLLYISQSRKAPMQTAMVAPSPVSAVQAVSQPSQLSSSPPVTTPSSAQPSTIQQSAQPTPTALASNPPAAEMRTNKPDTAPSTASLAGRWHWDADCAGTRWSGKLDIVDSLQGRFTGNFDGTQWYDIGTISDGHFDGNSLSFTRTSGTYVQYWNGHIAGGRLEGSATATNANCTWVATRD